MLRDRVMICIWNGSEEGRTDGYHHEFDTIEVLDFASRPWGLSRFIHGHIHVTPERALRFIVRRGRSRGRRTHELHAAIASPDGPEHGLKSANILARLLWRPGNRNTVPFIRDPGVDVTFKRTSCPVQKRFPSAPNPLG
jgi:hypothetical protein